MERIKIKDLLATKPENQPVTVQGWVRTFRNNQFIAINDGSTIQNIQAVVDFTNTPEALLKRITTGACLSVKGTLVPSPAKGQPVELKVQELEILGDSDPEKYPLQPKKTFDGVPEGDRAFATAHKHFRGSDAFAACDGLRGPQIF